MTDPDRTPTRVSGPRHLILRNELYAGDALMMTVAVRDLHLAQSGRFLADVRRRAHEVWEHNPCVAPIADDEPAAVAIVMHYPPIDRSNDTPHHLIHDSLAGRLGLPIPVPQSGGDIHISDEGRAGLVLAG